MRQSRRAGDAALRALAVDRRGADRDVSGSVDRDGIGTPRSPGAAHVQRGAGACEGLRADSRRAWSTPIAAAPVLSNISAPLAAMAAPPMAAAPVA
jgi:hypothetical protein